MDPVTKIREIEFMLEKLDSMPWQQQELVLRVYELPERDINRSLQDILLDASDEQLHRLASYLHGDDVQETAETGGEPKTFSIFASHLHSDRELVARYKAEFERYGMSLFVAHSNIQVGQTWAEVIKSNLRTCDAGVVFFREEFKKSAWCDQEVGWMLGRGLVPFTLMLDGTPAYGPLGDIQGVPVGERAPSQVVPSIIEHFRNQAASQPRLVESLIIGLERCDSFNDTERVWDQLRDYRSLTTTQISKVIEITDANNQVVGGEYRGTKFPADYRKPFVELFEQYVKEQANYDAQEHSSSWWQ